MRFIRRRVSSSPDWTGMWMYGHIVLRLARVWINSSEKSLGCGDMNRRRLRPFLWSLSISLRRMAKGDLPRFSNFLDFLSKKLRPYEFTVCPTSVISIAPSSTCLVHSFKISLRSF